MLERIATLEDALQEVKDSQSNAVGGTDGRVCGDNETDH